MYGKTLQEAECRWGILQSSKGNVYRGVSGEGMEGMGTAVSQCWVPAASIDYSSSHWPQAGHLPENRPPI